MDCPEENELLDFVRGELGDAQRHALETHIDECPVCPLVLAELARLEEPDDELAITDGEFEQLPLPGSVGSAPKSKIKVAPLLREGDKVGRYVILNRVGAGGMGVVYAAYDPELDRKVAIKILLTSLGGSLPKEFEEQRKRLMREAQAMAKLSHPNVITVHDVGEYRDQVFVAMEFIDGSTLGGWREQVPRSWREIADVFFAAGDGLAAAHKAGLVHRDFKPDNVLIGKDGRVIVTDFGLARPAAGRTDSFSSVDVMESTPVLSAQLTKTGALVGTPAYMAPEQLAGERSDALADQFSFCVALYEALYKERPFEGKVLSHLMASVAAGRVQPPPRDANVPRWIRRALLRGLQVRPEDRFADMPSALLALRRDPRKLWRRWGAVVFPSAVLAVGIVAYQQDTPTVPNYCDNVSGLLGGAWDPQVETRLEAAFTASGRDYAPKVWESTQTRLEDYAKSWVTSQEGACRDEIEGSQPQAVLVLRMGCLDQQLEELRALTSELSIADENLLDRAVDAVEALPSPEICSDVTRLSARLTGIETPTARKIRNELEIELSRAKVLRNTARYDRARAQGEATLERAREAGDRWIESEALTGLADLHDLTGHIEEAKAGYHLAMSAALASNNGGVVARVAIGLLWGISEANAGLDDAIRWYEHGRAALERLGRDPDLEAQLENAIAVNYLNHGEFEDAEVHMRKALEIRVDAMGADHPSLNSTWTNLGRLHVSQGRFDDAQAAFERARDLTILELGPMHPTVGNTYTNLGALAADRKRYVEARENFEQSLEIHEAARGEGYLHNATTHSNLGHSLRHSGLLDKASEHYQKALEIQRALLPPNAVGTIRTLSWQLWVALLRGETEEALAIGEAATRAFEANDESPEWLEPTIRSNYARALLEAGDYEAAQMQAQTAIGDRAADDPRRPLLDLIELTARVKGGDRNRSLSSEAEDAIARLHEFDVDPAESAEGDLLYAQLRWDLGDEKAAREAADVAVAAFEGVAVELGPRATAAILWRAQTFGE